jgi:hypothetical protein
MRSSYDKHRLPIRTGQSVWLSADAKIPDRSFDMMCHTSLPAGLAR